MPGFFESGDRGIHRAVVFFGEAQIGEDAIVAVDCWLADFFAIDGDDALANLTGGFGDELFEPGAEIGDAGGSENGDFVAALIGGDAEMVPRITPRFFSGAVVGPQALTIFCVVFRNFERSRPMTAPGTVPKCESAE